MKRAADVLRGIGHRVKSYVPRLRAEGIIIKWRSRIADAYAAWAASMSKDKETIEQLKSKNAIVVVHMDMVTEMMYAMGYAQDDFRVLDLSQKGPICVYHGMTIRCDPHQKDCKLVRVELEDKE